MKAVDDEVSTTTLPDAPAWMGPALQHFEELVAKKRLGHAYLVISEDPLQAALFTHLIACRRLCQHDDAAPCGTCLGCKSFINKTHGDLLEVKAEPGKTAIGVEQIRAAARFLQQTALYGHIKILLIEGAEVMTPAAANSLLKTLEEPSGNSLLMLSAGEAWRLPPTIRSRCQLINLSLPSHDEALSWLVNDQEWEHAHAEVALLLHNGRAITARTEAAATAGETLPALLESFTSVTRAGGTATSVPAVWGDVDISVLVYQLMAWCERQASGTDLHTSRVQAQHWLLLHRCLTELWSRLRAGAAPAKEVMTAEIFRLCRSTSHPQFSSIAEQFLAGLGKYGVAG
jgi:DNA polymerase-3 subunit delta'